VSPLWGKNPIFAPMSKNNAGMAVLCAGLPVTVITRMILNATDMSRRPINMTMPVSAACRMSETILRTAVLVL